MSERDRTIWERTPDASTVDPREERLRVLSAAAYDPVKPSETLRRKVAEVTQLQDSRALCVAGRWWVPGLRWAPAAGILTAALLLVLGLVLVRSNEHRLTAGQTPPIVVRRPPDSTLPAPYSVSPHLRHNRRPQIDRPKRMRPRTRREEIRPTQFPVAYPEAPIAGDAVRVHRDPEAVPLQWMPVRQEERDAIEERVRRAVPVRDDFVRIPFPRIAANSDRQIAEAVESYKREAAIVDARLSRPVTLQQKATPLVDLCEHLRGDTGIQLTAGSSVADEKVTLFCKELPLRDAMRQLSRPFGYTWLRSGKAGQYKYELVQDLRSQLLEEELRNRDRNQALLALERDIERYRPFLDLSPDEALARSKTAPPVEKKLLEKLAGEGWGPIHVYDRLSRQDLEALRTGQTLVFSQDPNPGERPLSSELGRGVLQSLRATRAIKSGDGWQFTGDLTDPRGIPVTAVPELRGELMLGLPQSELGQFSLTGAPGYKMPGPNPGLFTGSGDPFAVGRSPSVLEPENGAANAPLARDPALRPRVTLQPQPSCGIAPSPGPSPKRGGEQLPLSVSGRGLGGGVNAPKVTSADVLEALHRATGMPLVADYYTRLYKPETVSVRNLPLFEALNQIADAMHLRWKKEESWLQFRSTSYFNDRLKEVPNRLLARWAAARRQHGFLTLDNLVEIAQLPDAQLDAKEIAEGARFCFGLVEWDLTHNANLRPQLRYLAQFTPAQREQAMSSTGLLFTKMSLAQQQQFLSFALGSDGPLQSLEELKGATLRVEYTQPGRFQWGSPDEFGSRTWAVPMEAGPEGKRIVRPVVREQTREAALAALRRVDPRIRERVYQLMRQNDPRLEAAPPTDETQIFPTQLGLAVVSIPSDTNARGIHEVSLRGNVYHYYR